MTAKKALGVLVSGRGSNLQAILDAIHAGRLPLAKVGVVISDNPEAKALLRVRGMGIPAVVLERKAFADRTAYETALADELERHQVDLVVLAGFMRILSSCFIQRFPGAIVNIHPSLLPAFPGLDAQGQALRYGVKVAGCTVHFVDEGMDSGPIILQEAVPVELGDTTQTLADRILHVEHRLYPRAIALFCEQRLEIEGRQVHIRSEK
nr:phosphoribosylglycinamide formyltransferase [uncultured Anaeromusa sp.]